MDLRSRWTSGTARVRVYVRTVNSGGKIHRPGAVFSFASVFQTVLYTGVCRSTLNIRYSGLGNGRLSSGGFTTTCGHGGEFNTGGYVLASL